MNKFVKVIEIILIVLGVIAGASLIVGYIFFKDNTIEIINNIKDFINQPLPIIGVSTLGVGLFIYEIVVRTNYGKRMLNTIKNEKDKEIEQLKEKQLELEQIKKDIDSTLEEYGLNLEQLKGYLVELCSYSRNVKVNDLKNEILNGGAKNGETKDSSTNEE